MKSASRHCCCVHGAGHGVQPGPGVGLAPVQARDLVQLRGGGAAAGHGLALGENITLLPPLAVWQQKH